MKIERTITAKDGTEIKLVAQEMFGQGGFRSVDVYALKRQTPSEPWALLNDRPHPQWRTMSVDQYVKEGRPELLQMVGQAEILKTIVLLNDASAEQARMDHEHEATLNEQTARERMRQTA